jgi:hypothetical protein
MKGMKIRIVNEIPEEYANAKPLKTYETQYVYTGFRRYDLVRHVLEEFKETREGIRMKQTPMDPTSVLSRAYAAETIRVTVYSESPRVWKEVLNPFVTHFFLEMQDQQDAAAAATSST